MLKIENRKKQKKTKPIKQTKPLEEQYLEDRREYNTEYKWRDSISMVEEPNI